MATITTRSTAGGGATVKNLPLTNAEIDTNFINLNDHKVEDTDAVSTNTASKVVRRDASGGFSAGDLSIGNLNGSSVTLTGDIAVNGGDLTTTATTFNLLTSAATTIAFGNAATSLSIGHSVTGAQTVNFATGATTSGNTKTVNLATSGLSGSITNLNIGSSAGTSLITISGAVTATGNISSNYSDERLKEQITLIDNPLNKVEQLRGVTYLPNSIAESFGYEKKQQVGVIAQDVQKVLPEAVQPAPFDILLYEGTQISRSGENYMTVQYEKIVPLLIEAIKELNKQIKELKGVE